jgi:hypothetical protein
VKGPPRGQRRRKIGAGERGLAASTGPRGRYWQCRARMHRASRWFPPVFVRSHENRLEGRSDAGSSASAAVIQTAEPRKRSAADFPHVHKDRVAIDGLSVAELGCSEHTLSPPSHLSRAGTQHPADKPVRGAWIPLSCRSACSTTLVPIASLITEQTGIVLFPFPLEYGTSAPIDVMWSLRVFLSHVQDEVSPPVPPAFPRCGMFPSLGSHGRA